MKCDVRALLVGADCKDFKPTGLVGFFEVEIKSTAFARSHSKNLVL